MKVILIGFFLLLSSNLQAATFDSLTGSVSHPDLGGYTLCSQASCISGSVASPVVYENTNDTGQPVPDTENEFWVGPLGADRVDRKMSTSRSYYLNDNVSGIVTWESHDLYGDVAEMYVFGLSIDLLSTPSGTMPLSLSLYSIYDAYISIKANSLDTYAGWKFDFEIVDNQPIAPPSEVPLPASLFLLAPVLIGFMGLRRKAKSS